MSLDFEPQGKVPGKGSPVANSVLAMASSSNTSSPIGNYRRLVITPEGTATPVWDREDRHQLSHARSLDDLLAKETPVVVELSQNKVSKYSRVVITASTYDLREEELEPEETEKSEEERALKIVTGTIYIAQNVTATTTTTTTTTTFMLLGWG